MTNPNPQPVSEADLGALVKRLKKKADYTDRFFDNQTVGVLYRVAATAITSLRNQLTASEAREPKGETLESMIAWGDETFGPCTAERAQERAWEEWLEMQSEEPGTERHAIEGADVVICLLRIPGILDALNKKMAKNRARQWRLMGDGTGYHIKDTAPPNTENHHHGR